MQSLVAIPWLHDDVIPPVCVCGPVPRGVVYIGAIDSCTKSHEQHQLLGICHACVLIQQVSGHKILLTCLPMHHGCPCLFLKQESKP